MSCGVGCRLGWDLALLWLWCRLAAVALIRPPAWEPPWALGAVLKSKKKGKKEKEKALREEKFKGWSSHAPGRVVSVNIEVAEEHDGGWGGKEACESEASTTSERGP